MANQVDSVTGYTFVEAEGTIQPKNKTAFLKIFKKCGDKTKAADAQGFRYFDFDAELKSDAKFASDYKETLLSMKHELEGIMFENAFKANGHRERQSWLETHYPEEYGKKIAAKGPKSKSKIDTLLENL